MDNRIRPIDANHMLTRLKPPENKEDFVIQEAVKVFIDTEPTIEKYRDPSDEIRWTASVRQRKTPNVHAVTYGVECSRCHCFSLFERRFCPDCGGWYDGPILVRTSRR